MLMALLAFVAVVLTVAMFATRRMLLGYPSAIFWAIIGGHAFNESTATWDIYYLIFFASLAGMVPFCVLGMYALREKRDTIGDEEMERGDGGYIDERSEPKISAMKEPRFDEESMETEMGPRMKAFKNRHKKPKQKSIDYGEFS